MEEMRQYVLFLSSVNNKFEYLEYLLINILGWAVQFAHIYLRNMWKVIFILNSCRSRLYGTLNMQKKNQKTSTTRSIFCSFSFVALKTIHIVKLWSFFWC